MSTPLLDTYHLAITAHSLGHHASHGRTTKSSATLAANLCRNLDVPVFGHDDGLPEGAAANLMFDLQRMNANAYATRYGKRTPKVTPPKLPAHTAALDPVALLKALRCIRYNCDGGEAIGDSFQAALKTVDALMETLKDHIIDSLQAYQDAEWFLSKPVAA